MRSEFTEQGFKRASCNSELGAFECLKIRHIKSGRWQYINQQIKSPRAEHFSATCGTSTSSGNNHPTSKGIPVMSPSHDAEWNDSWPAPLSRKIDVWIWSSLLLSLVLVPALQLNNNRNFIVLIPSVLVPILYNATLLVLSRKERKIAVYAETFTIEDIITRRQSTLRSTTTFWILAVCQIYLALLGLYIPARLIFLFCGPSGKMHIVCIELLFAVGQMAVMGYISGCCIVHDEVSRLRGLSGNQT